MNDVIVYLVDCKRGGALIATYEFPQGITLAGPPPAPDREFLEREAKGNLTQQRLAFPPYADITFHIRRQ